MNPIDPQLDIERRENNRLIERLRQENSALLADLFATQSQCLDEVCLRLEAEKQRNDLLVALETLTAQAKRHGVEGVWWDEANAAITKAKGSASGSAKEGGEA
jgi:hypothetical protein